jgi:hypothetical protein
VAVVNRLLYAICHTGTGVCIQPISANVTDVTEKAVQIIIVQILKLS